MNIDANVIGLGIEAAKLVAMAIEHIAASVSLSDADKQKAINDIRAQLTQDNKDVQTLPVRDIPGTTG